MNLNGFTERAKSVMRLATQEARGLNHEYIGTEHVLLGLVHKGVIESTVLEHLDMDLSKVRAEVVKLTTSWPETVTMCEPRMTLRVKKVLEYAREEATKLSCKYIGAEHLLMGLLREPKSIAAKAIEALGFNLEAIRQKIADIFNGGKAIVLDGDLPVSHTPAPWFVFNNGHCVGGPYIPGPDDDPEQMTAGVAMCSMRMRTNEEAAANAKLIAAAPDMAALLRDIRPHLVDPFLSSRLDMILLGAGVEI